MSSSLTLTDRLSRLVAKETELAMVEIVDRAEIVIPPKITKSLTIDSYKTRREKQRDIEIDGATKRSNERCEDDISTYNTTLNNLTNEFVHTIKSEEIFIYKIHGTGYDGDIFEPPIKEAVDTFKQRVTEKGYSFNVETKKTYSSFDKELSGCWLEITVA